jgi:hypothetical protein
MQHAHATAWTEFVGCAKAAAADNRAVKLAQPSKARFR